MCKTAIDTFGKFDAMVTNASKIGYNLSIEAAQDEISEAIIDCGVKGMIWWNREAMKHFLERDDGCMLNIGSNNIGRKELIIVNQDFAKNKEISWSDPLPKCNNLTILLSKLGVDQVNVIKLELQQK